jgi:hypothetical protein
MVVSQAVKNGLFFLNLGHFFSTPIKMGYSFENNYQLFTRAKAVNQPKMGQLKKISGQIYSKSKKK